MCSKLKMWFNMWTKFNQRFPILPPDGVEEVFAAVGESVSLSCRNTSSLGVGGSVEWAMGERTQTDDISPYQGQIEAFNVNGDSSLVIYKVSALQAGDYKCSESSEQQKVLHKIRLYTLDGEHQNTARSVQQLIFPLKVIWTFSIMFVFTVTSECKQGVENLTLTCVLTCSKDCKKDLNLTWSGADQNSVQSGLMSVNNTLTKRLFLPVLSMTSEKITCLVHREGEVMASKRWHTVNCKHAVLAFSPKYIHTWDKKKISFVFTYKLTIILCLQLCRPQRG